MRALTFKALLFVGALITFSSGVLIEDLALSSFSVLVKGISNSVLLRAVKTLYGNKFNFDETKNAEILNYVSAFSLYPFIII